MNKKERALKVIDLLTAEFPQVSTPLIHSTAFELLVATMLSAQTLDATTNTVTPALFERYPDPVMLGEASPNEIQQFIRKINYYKTKSRNLVAMAQKLLDKFHGEVPRNIEDLTTLPGVGKKTANVVINEWFCKHEGVSPSGFVVDTHVKRVSERLELTKQKDPEKVEVDLMNLIPQEKWEETSLRFIFHGRKTCISRNPKCSSCVLRDICPSSEKFTQKK